MIIKIFGQLNDIVGSNSIQVDDAANTDELTQQLHSKYPALINSKYKIAVNRTIIQSTMSLHKDAEIALLPPFSGG